MTRRLSRIPFTHRGCATPKLAIIGGRLEDDNDAIYDEMRRLAGPMTPLTYLRSWRWAEPYVDHAGTGRLVVLDGRALGV